MKRPISVDKLYRIRSTANHVLFKDGDGKRYYCDNVPVEYFVFRKKPIVYSGSKIKRESENLTWFERKEVIATYSKYIHDFESLRWAKIAAAIAVNECFRPEEAKVFMQYLADKNIQAVQEPISLPTSWKSLYLTSSSVYPEPRKCIVKDLSKILNYNLPFILLTIYDCKNPRVITKPFNKGRKN